MIALDFCVDVSKRLQGRIILLSFAQQAQMAQPRELYSERSFAGKRAKDGRRWYCTQPCCNKKADVIGGEATCGPWIAARTWSLNSGSLLVG